MHQLSVIIVNYNVKHFLEQVLISVERATRELDAETWVVDNNSVDGSMEMVADKFPWVKTIINKQNVGFSKANNQAILQSNSKYILLLNPDTVLQDDTLEKCVDYMDQHTEVGGLGVRMIDGKGKFLPESKRGLPTPSVAFFKMTGLASIFPKSKYFGRYHMKYLSEFDNHEVDVLAGAYMFMRSETLDKVGLLDEQFFMYGEDIDLSYRITLGGYKNVYFAETTIIHYKGESTKKKSVNYVRVFYNAMVLFAKKHYSSRMAGWFSFWINIAVFLRAALALVIQLMSTFVLFGADFLLMASGFVGIAKYWELYNKYVPDFYPSQYYWVHIPVYILVIQFSVWISGGYDKPFKGYRMFRGGVAGAVLLFAVYGFLSKELQFSRAILAFGAAWSIGIILAFRVILDRFNIGGIHFLKSDEKRVLIVAEETEFIRISELLNRSEVRHTLLGRVSVDGQKPAIPKPEKIQHSEVQFEVNHIGSIGQLDEIAEIFSANLIIFSGKDVPASEIMRSMSDFSESDVQLKIAPDKGEFIIGSDSKNEPGELFTVEVKYSIAETYNRRRKRIFDLLISLGMLLLLPLTALVCLFWKPLRLLYSEVFSVLLGNKTWVSYSGLESAKMLPKIKPGVIFSSNGWTNTSFEGNVNYIYAREYSVGKDVQSLLHFLFNRLE
jgi:GT2 family glycosyltransferase